MAMNGLSIFPTSLAEDLFNAFDRGLTSLTPASMDAGIGAAPRVDIRETKDSYVIEMELPGMTEKDVQISLKDRTLSVSSVKKDEKEERKEKDGHVQYLLRERRSYDFVRRFTIPADVSADNVDACVKNGLLTVTLGKHPEIQARSIEIKSE